jgi:hypothetical protein
MKALSFLLSFCFTSLLCIFVEGKNKGKPTKNLVNGNGKNLASGRWVYLKLVLFVADSVFSSIYETMFPMGAIKAIPDSSSVITGGSRNRAVSLE